MQKKSLFNFNHINPKLDPQIKEKFDSLYHHYRKQEQTHRKTFRYYKYLDLCCTIGSATLFCGGILAGGLTANPVILESITTSGMVLKAYAETKNFKRKVEMSRFAFTSYAKVLTQVRLYLRGIEYDQSKFPTEINQLDLIIIDLSLPAHRYDEKYKKEFTTKK